MPRKRERIGDDLLVANGVWDLDPSLPLSPRQVSLITGLGLGQLKERRRTRPPQPPFPFRRDEDKPGSAVWYPLGEALSYKRERLPRLLPPLGTASAPPRTFAALMAQGLPDQLWPFQRALDGSLVDFFAALRQGRWIDPDGEAECLWLTLAQYLDATAEWLARQRSLAHERLLAAELPQAGETVATNYGSDPTDGKSGSRRRRRL